MCTHAYTFVKILCDLIAGDGSSLDFTLAYSSWKQSLVHVSSVLKIPLGIFRCSDLYLALVIQERALSPLVFLVDSGIGPSPIIRIIKRSIPPNDS